MKEILVDWKIKGTLALFSTTKNTVNYDRFKAIK